MRKGKDMKRKLTPELHDSNMCFFFFFKQKTAYEIKECDWSSDVCSSDLGMRNRKQRLPLRFCRQLCASNCSGPLAVVPDGPAERPVPAKAHWYHPYWPQQYPSLRGVPRNPELDRKSTRLNSSHIPLSRMPSSA